MHNSLADQPIRSPSPTTTSWPVLHAHSLTIRPLQPSDVDLLVRFGLGLSSETRYRRFMGGGVRFTPELLEQLLKIDSDRDLALVATVTLDGRETPIGITRYAGLPDGATAEIALTVADAWQGCGIGRALLARLIELARERGLRALVGDTLATNEPMMRLARSLGFTVRSHPDGAALKYLERDLGDEHSAFVGRGAPAAGSEA